MDLDEQALEKKVKEDHCPRCKVTLLQTNLWRHIRECHLDLRPWKCEICNLSFHRNEHLHNHIQGVHLKSRPFSCSRCSKRCSSRDVLRKHIRLVHEKHIRPFLCAQCGKSFPLREYLKRHLKIAHLIQSTTRQGYERISSLRAAVDQNKVFQYWRRYFQARKGRAANKLLNVMPASSNREIDEAQPGTSNEGSNNQASDQLPVPVDALSDRNGEAQQNCESVTEIFAETYSPMLNQENSFKNRMEHFFGHSRPASDHRSGYGSQLRFTLSEENPNDQSTNADRTNSLTPEITAARRSEEDRRPVETHQCESVKREYRRGYSERHWIKDHRRSRGRSRFRGGGRGRGQSRRSRASVDSLALIEDTQAALLESWAIVKHSGEAGKSPEPNEVSSEAQPAPAHARSSPECSPPLGSANISGEDGRESPLDEFDARNYTDVTWKDGCLVLNNGEAYTKERGGRNGRRRRRRRKAKRDRSPRSPVRFDLEGRSDNGHRQERSNPRSPIRSSPRSPIRSSPHSPIRSSPHSPIRISPRSPIRSSPRSPIRYDTEEKSDIRLQYSDSPRHDTARDSYYPNQFRDRGNPVGFNNICEESFARNCRRRSVSKERGTTHDEPSDATSPLHPSFKLEVNDEFNQNPETEGERWNQPSCSNSPARQTDPAALTGVYPPPVLSYSNISATSLADYEDNHSDGGIQMSMSISVKNDFYRPHVSAIHFPPNSNRVVAVTSRESCFRCDRCRRDSDLDLQFTFRRPEPCGCPQHRHEYRDCGRERDRSPSRQPPSYGQNRSGSPFSQRPGYTQNWSGSPPPPLLGYRQNRSGPEQVTEGMREQVRSRSPSVESRRVTFGGRNRIEDRLGRSYRNDDSNEDNGHRRRRSYSPIRFPTSRAEDQRAGRRERSPAPNSGRGSPTYTPRYDQRHGSSSAYHSPPYGRWD